jgi:hypothetical protein
MTESTLSALPTFNLLEPVAGGNALAIADPYEFVCSISPYVVIDAVIPGFSEYGL